MSPDFSPVVIATLTRGHFGTIDCKRSGCSHCDVTRYFVDYCVETLSLHFGVLVFLEPELTDFGREGRACSQLTLVPAT